MKMLRDCILVEIQKEVKTKHGIHLPTQSVEDVARIASIGVAKDAGPDCSFVKKGDKVFFKSYVGNWIDHEDFSKASLWVVVSENDVIGIL